MLKVKMLHNSYEMLHYLHLHIAVLCTSGKGFKCIATNISQLCCFFICLKILVVPKLVVTGIDGRQVSKCQNTFS